MSRRLRAQIRRNFDHLMEERHVRTLAEADAQPLFPTLGLVIFGQPGAELSRFCSNNRIEPRVEGWIPAEGFSAYDIFLDQIRIFGDHLLNRVGQKLSLALRGAKGPAGQDSGELFTHLLLGKRWLRQGLQWQRRIRRRAGIFKLSRPQTQKFRWLASIAIHGPLPPRTRAAMRETAYRSVRV